MATVSAADECANGAQYAFLISWVPGALGIGLVVFATSPAAYVFGAMLCLAAAAMNLYGIARMIRGAREILRDVHASARLHLDANARAVPPAGVRISVPVRTAREEPVTHLTARADDAPQAADSSHKGVDATRVLASDALLLEQAHGTYTLYGARACIAFVKRKSIEKGLGAVELTEAQATELFG